MVGEFYFGQPKINSVISLILCQLLHLTVTPDTSVEFSNFHETLSSIHFSVEGKEYMFSSIMSFSYTFHVIINH